MRNLVPLTKILLTFGTAVWAIVLSEPTSLAALCALELLILLVSGELIKNLKALLALVIFAVMLGVIEYIGGGSVKECNVAALRMLGMTIIFIYLLGTVKLQDLTASMVRQLKVPYEYAFMFTAGASFHPGLYRRKQSGLRSTGLPRSGSEREFFQAGETLYVHRPPAHAPFARTQRDHGTLTRAPRLRRLEPYLHGKRRAERERLCCHGTDCSPYRFRHLWTCEAGTVVWLADW